MKVKPWAAALAAAVLITGVWMAGVSREADGLSDKLIRLHVVANSDSGDDQALKLRVRDAVLAELTPLLEGASGRAEAQARVEADLDGVTAAAERTAAAAGRDYRVRVSLKRELFPTTEYSTFSLPAGTYTSLRVVIGEGKGHNWWCVVFPPVCTAAALDEETASAVGLTPEETKLMTEENGGYVVRFRAMELIGRLKAFFGK